MGSTAEYSKEYYYVNREKCLAQAKVYRERNRKKIRADRKEYYYANREKCLAQGKAYRERNKKKVRAGQAVWRKKNREKIRAYHVKYNDSKRIENEYNEWNDTLRELGYGDLI